ncbi:MAG: hypothetical protein AAGD06_19790, partial [Acidobacteriota bacterium]
MRRHSTFDTAFPFAPQRPHLRVGLLFASLALFLWALPAAAAVPPVPTQGSPACGALVGGKCYVGSNFSISTSSPGAHHFKICRSSDVAGWGGCDTVMSSNTGSTYTVSGSNLPSDGFRRAYYWSACDSANACTGWADNPEVYVYRDASGPSAPGNTQVACSYTAGGTCWVQGNFTVSVNAAVDALSGVDGYHICRSNNSSGGFAGCETNMTLTGGTSFTVSGSNLPSDGFRRAYWFRAQDRVGNWGPWNSPKYVQVDRYAPTASASGASATWTGGATATIAAADTTGGGAANSGLAEVRYRWNAALNGACTNGTVTTPGATLTAPEGDNRLYVCARDRVGRVSQWNGQYRVDTAPPSAPGNTTVACAYSTDPPFECWVTGNFTASVAPATDASGIARYNVCRSNDSTGGFAGCHTTVTQDGGTSIAISGTHLPSDGFRRSYFFRAQDNAGNWGPWNQPRYVRVDRNAPTVSASGASADWVASATAAVSAADLTGGAAANSGLAEIRYRWNAATNAACTNGTVTSSGATLTAPAGDNVLYLCARDRTGRVGSWSGQYRVDAGPPSAPGPTTVSCPYSTEIPSECWVAGDFVATVTPASDPSGIAGYNVCRSNDSAGGFAGCQATVTQSGGTSITISGSHLPGDGFRRSYFFRAQDNSGAWGPWNQPRYVRVDRHDPQVSATNASPEWFEERTATVQANDTAGGAGANSGLADVRYRWNAPTNGGCTNGTAVTAGTTLNVPAGDNVLYLCGRDRVGRVGQWNGQYRVDSAAPTAPGPTTVSCAYTTDPPFECWVTGDFVATVTPSSDPSGIAGYNVCRSNDSAGGFAGCEATVTQNGGTSITISGSHLPSDGFRRSYFFRAQDNNGVWGPWNQPRYVRVDRHNPRVSATNASDQWFAERTLVMSADDAGGPGAGANTGLAEARYRWNAPTNATCTDGTVFNSGDSLTVPEGGNVLHLCGRDRAGRVGTWTGNYRVDNTQPVRDSLTVSSHQWSIGDGSTYQITAKASDTGSGIRELRALINLQGSNAGNPRGNYSWQDQSLGYLWSADQVPCQGGGFASKRPDAFNPGTATLVGCTTSLAGNQRTVIFTIRPENSFGEHPANDISFWTRDFRLNATNWQNYDLNFSSVDLPDPILMVLDGGSALPHNGNVNWGTVEQGSGGGGQVPRTLTVRNAAPAGSSPLILVGTPSNVQITGSSRFSLSGTLDSPLQPGQQDTFVVRLNTAQAGTFNGQIQIWHSDPNRPLPLRINLRATVESTDPPRLEVRNGSNPPISHSGSLSWGSVEPNSGTNNVVGKNIVVKNTAASGAGNLVLVHSPTNVEVQNTQGNAFSWAGTLVSPLAPGQQDNFAARLNTSTEGSFAAVLKIWHNDPAVPNPYLMNLSGTVSTVVVGEPDITDITPERITNGRKTTVTVRGTNLGGTGVSFAQMDPPEGAAPRSFPTARVLSVNPAGTSMQVEVDATDTNVEDFHNLVAENSQGADAEPLRVLPQGPLVDLWSPGQPETGRVYLLAVAGHNLQGASLSVTRGQMLSLVNTADDRLSGRYRAPSTPGPAEIVVTKNGQQVRLPIQVVGAGRSTLETREVTAGLKERLGAQQAASVPSVYIQAPSVREAASRLNGQPMQMSALKGGEIQEPSQGARMLIPGDSLKARFRALAAGEEPPPEDVQEALQVIESMEESELREALEQVQKLDAAAIQAADLESGELSAAERAFFILFRFRWKLVEFHHTEAILFDPDTGAEGDAILQGLGLGDQVRIGGLVLSFYLRVDLTISWWYDFTSGFTYPIFCLEGIFASEIPGTPGVAIQVNYCTGFGGSANSSGTTTSTTFGGGDCAEATDDGPPIDGRGFATVTQNDCCEQPIGLQALGTTFQGFFFQQNFNVNNPEAGTARPAEQCTGCGGTVFLESEKTLNPGQSNVALMASIRNTSDKTCVYNWEIDKSGGSPTLTFNPESGQITLQKGIQQSLGIKVSVPNNTPATDDAEMRLRVTSRPQQPGGGPPMTLAAENKKMACILPTDEITEFRGWAPIVGDLARFDMAVTPFGPDFTGRDIEEAAD